VLLTSTDLDELQALCHRVFVLHRGRLCAELAGDRLHARTVLEAMNTGVATAAV
jgi:ABC-type sugar transport system ATPase subunit